MKYSAMSGGRKLSPSVRNCLLNWSSVVSYDTGNSSEWFKNWSNCPLNFLVIFMKYEAPCSLCLNPNTPTFTSLFHCNNYKKKSQSFNCNVTDGDGMICLGKEDPFYKFLKHFLKSCPFVNIIWDYYSSIFVRILTNSGHLDVLSAVPFFVHKCH